MQMLCKGSPKAGVRAVRPCSQACRSAVISLPTRPRPERDDARGGGSRPCSHLTDDTRRVRIALKLGSLDPGSALAGGSDTEGGMSRRKCLVVAVLTCAGLMSVAQPVAATFPARTSSSTLRITSR
jgi:hypothetical protein